MANSWDVIVDTTGRFLAPSIAALARGGRVVVMVSPGQGTEPVPVRDLYRREASIVGVNSLLHSSVECGELLRRLAPHFESGALRAPERIQPHPLGSCGDRGRHRRDRLDGLFVVEGGKRGWRQ